MGPPVPAAPSHVRAERAHSETAAHAARGPAPTSRARRADLSRAAGWAEDRGDDSVFARAPSRGVPAPAPSRKGSGKRRADVVLGLRAHTLLLGKLQGAGGACVLPKTHASVKALTEEFK